ncbi:MAG: AsnC family transcriptional regulator [Gammaproteobacteria bacterium]|nr:AsnC family transcriptional regulator [Gammaproteobacteria bacterium]
MGLENTNGYDLSLDERDCRLIAALQNGLPLVPHPYAAIGASAGMNEAEVIARLHRMLESGVVKRFGVVVRHHELGYRANAMVVWDVPDERATELGQRVASHDFVTLCYRRARCLPDWPYNLYCMIHGRDRNLVHNKVSYLIKACDLQALRHEVLFSLQRFKQRGARYVRPAAETANLGPAVGG